MITEFLPHHFSHLAWRIPFALSGILFVIYLYLNQRFAVANYPTHKPHKKRNNVFISLLRQWQAIIAVVALTSMAASLYYLVFTYLVSYRINYLGVSKENAFLLNSVILALACFLYPLFGKLADKAGYYRIFIIVGILFLLGAYPLLQLFKSSGTLGPLVTLTLFTICMAAIQGAISPLFALTFEDEWIATGCALAYSIGNGLSGGAPLLAETLNHYFKFGLTAFVIILLVIGFLGMHFILRILIFNEKSSVTFS